MQQAGSVCWVWAVQWVFVVEHEISPCSLDKKMTRISDKSRYYFIFRFALRPDGHQLRQVCE